MRFFELRGSNGRNLPRNWAWRILDFVGHDYNADHPTT
jgi:hypothetical protein